MQKIKTYTGNITLEKAPVRADQNSSVLALCRKANQKTNNHSIAVEYARLRTG